MPKPETARLVQGATPIGLLHRCTTSAATEFAPKLHRCTNAENKGQDAVQLHQQNPADCVGTPASRTSASFTGWLIVAYFTGLRLSGAILARLAGIVGAGRAAIGSSREGAASGRRDAAPRSCERHTLFED